MVLLIGENIVIQEAPEKGPNRTAFANVCITNHIIEVVIVEKRSKNLQHFQKYSQYAYIDKRTGEIKEYKKHDSLNRNRSFTKLRQYINANFTGQENEIFLTLTYANPEYERLKVAGDFKKFWKKFKYHNKNCEYIAIFEPHQTGAWHIHMLIKDFHQKYLYLDINQCNVLWAHGYIYVEKIRNNDNIGAYFTAICGQSSRDVSPGTKVERIKWYPRFSKCFSHSAHIQKPSYRVMKYSEVQNLVKNSCEVFSKSIAISENDTVLNHIVYKQYNSLRKDV